jgi:hypothetical protein
MVSPHVWFDPDKQITFINEVYFKHYLPSGEDVFNHLNNIQSFNLAILDRDGEIFIDNAQENQIANHFH